MDVPSTWIDLAPKWLDLAKISGIAVLTLAIVQYFKTNLPEKIVKFFAVAVGIALAILSDLYVGESVNWFKAIVNGALAAVLSDLGYTLLSKRGGLFTLPSKDVLDKQAPGK